MSLCTALLLLQNFKDGSGSSKYASFKEVKNTRCFFFFFKHFQWAKNVFCPRFSWMEDNLFFYNSEFIRVILFSLSWLLITMGIVNEVCFLMIRTCTVFLHPVSIERKHLVSQSLHLLNQAPSSPHLSFLGYLLFIYIIYYK